jgi:hypothetical protein
VIEIGTLKIRPKYGHSKIQYTYFLVNIFIVIFLNAHFFLVMYHILKPYKTSLDEMITKRSTWREVYILDPSWYFHFKSQLLCMFCVYLLTFIFIQVGNFNLLKNWHIDDFIICLWQLNTIHYVKSPWCCKMQSILTCNYLV